MPPECSVVMITSRADFDLELGVRVDGDAAAVVGDGEEPVGLDAPPRSRWRGRPPPRPWRCRSPRRTGGAAPSRRCRRRTCRAGAAPARGLRAPRCRRPCSSRTPSAGLRAPRATFSFTSCFMSSTGSMSSTVSGSTSSAASGCTSFGTLRVGGFHGGRHRLWGRWILASGARRLLQDLQLRPRLLGLAALGLVGFAEQVAQGTQTECCHVF